LRGGVVAEEGEEKLEEKGGEDQRRRGEGAFGRGVIQEAVVRWAYKALLQPGCCTGSPALCGMP